MSFPLAWEAAVYDQLRSIITLDIITLELVRTIVQGRPLPGPQRVLEERAACLAPRLSGPSAFGNCLSKGSRSTGPTPADARAADAADPSKPASQQ